MKKSELFALKNMFQSNNIASVGVQISSPHTEGVFVCAFYILVKLLMIGKCIRKLLQRQPGTQRDPQKLLI